MSPIILNATITETSVAIEGSFIVAIVKFEYDVRCYTLKIPIGEKGARGAVKSVKYGPRNMDTLMRFACSDTWEGMKGKHIRVEVKDDFFGSPAVRIGHIVKDEWIKIVGIDK